MPHAVVNSAAPAKLFYQVHRPDVEEQGRCLLCQGWTAEGYLWEPQLAALLAQGFACVTFDNRGSGRSEHPLYRYTTRMLARDAMELLCAAVGWQPDSVNLVGISMGGMHEMAGAKCDQPSYLEITSVRTIPWQQSAHRRWYIMWVRH